MLILISLIYLFLQNEWHVGRVGFQNPLAWNVKFLHVLQMPALFSLGSSSSTYVISHISVLLLALYSMGNWLLGTPVLKIEKWVFLVVFFLPSAAQKLFYQILCLFDRVTRQKSDNCTNQTIKQMQHRISKALWRRPRVFAEE